MLKTKLFIILIILFNFFIKVDVFAISNFAIPVEDAFFDISKDYKYYYELKTLYDKGIIEPEADGNFNPDKLLKREEFVGVAEETSCKKCIVPNVDKEFLEKYKQKPFFDVGLENKYFYCIADAKSDKFVLGYKPGDSCKDGTKKDGEIPFCLNNNITFQEALAVIMRMGGIMTAKQANIITSGIENGQNYPDLSSDMKPKNIDGSANSFYPYFKKALEYEVIDYDVNGNKKTYKLVEKRGKYLRPFNLITKQDFLKMAFIALKANSCIDKISQESTLAIKIKIFNKKCTEEKEQKGLCKLSDLESKENIYDFSSEVGGICQEGIDNKKGYIWRFYNLDTGTQVIKYGKYIDNYNFLDSGKYNIFLRIIDNCGNSSEVYNTLNILGETEVSLGDLSVSIDANPIFGNGPLEVDFTSIVGGGKGSFSYIWNFGDGRSGKGKLIKHIFIETGIYEVNLIVIDGDGNKGNANIFINVLDNKCSNDSDLDGINDCEDRCPIVKGITKNEGCPIFLPPSDDPSDGLSECLKKQGNSLFIFGNVICNSCPCTKSIDFRATIRECDMIIPAITSPTQKDIYSRGNLFQIR